LRKLTTVGKISMSIIQWCPEKEVWKWLKEGTNLIPHPLKGVLRELDVLHKPN